MSAQSKYYNTGGGELKFTPIVDGVLGSEEDFGQTENISFSTTVETLTHDNTETKTTFEDMNILKKVTGKMTIESIEISPAMLTKAFLGSLDTTNVSSGTAVSDTLVITALDTAYPVGIKYLSNLVVKDETDTTTYVEGTDYTVDLDKGEITALSTGTISASDTLHLTYDNASYNEYDIEAFINSKLEGTLRFISDSANGLSYIYTFHRVSLLASGDFSLKSSEDFLKLSFEGTILSSELISGDGISKMFKIEATEKM